MHPQNLFVSLLIIAQRLIKEIAVCAISDVLYCVKYSQNFWRNVLCVCSLLRMASTLVLSHTDTMTWPSSTLKLVPRFPFVEKTFSSWGGESETDIGLFWDVPKSYESIIISPVMIPV